MKTKRKKYNWLTELEKAVKKEPATNHLRMMERLAHQWPTCACGQLCKRLPRTLGVPDDAKTADLGYWFAVYVERHQWKRALETFHKIESRTVAILKRKDQTK